MKIGEFYKAVRILNRLDPERDIDFWKGSEEIMPIGIRFWDQLDEDDPLISFEFASVEPNKEYKEFWESGLLGDSKRLREYLKHI